MLTTTDSGEGGEQAHLPTSAQLENLDALSDDELLGELQARLLGLRIALQPLRTNMMSVAASFCLVIAGVALLAVLILSASGATLVVVPLAPVTSAFLAVPAAALLLTLFRKLSADLERDRITRALWRQWEILRATASSIEQEASRPASSPGSQL